jgi:hypothetical protein
VLSSFAPSLSLFLPAVILPSPSAALPTFFPLPPYLSLTKLILI